MKLTPCIAALLFLVGALAPGASGQQAASTSEQSYARARQVIEGALRAHGGDALARIEDYTIAARGTNSSLGESVRPAPPFGTDPVELNMTVVPRRGWMTFESSGSVPGGYCFYLRQFVKGRQGYAVDMLGNFLGGNASPSPMTVTDVERFMPHVFLHEAMERVGTLRWVGDGRADGRGVQIVSYMGPEKPHATMSQTTLFIDAESRLLRRVEQLAAHAVLGDAALAYVYPDYRTLSGVMVPTRHVLMGGTLPLQDVTYTDVRFNTRPPEGTFDLPARYRRPPPPSGQLTVQRVAENVYQLSGLNGYGYIEPRNAMFVVFRDHVMVLEGAPGRTSSGQAVIEKIRETVPNKPIRYVVITHPHFDHAGGIRAYVSAGIPIITTPGSGEWVTQVAGAQHTLSPDELSLNPRAPVVEYVRGSRTFTDGETTVELHDAGPTPHAAEELLAYFPKENIIFQGDLMTMPLDGSLHPAPEVTVYFAGWLQKRGWNPRQIYCVHGPTADTDYLRQSVARARTKSNNPSAARSAPAERR